jgi:hypothetical protein
MNRSPPPKPEDVDVDAPPPVPEVLAASAAPAPDELGLSKVLFDVFEHALAKTAAPPSEAKRPIVRARTERKRICFMESLDD